MFTRCIVFLDDNVSDDIKGNLKKRQRSVLFMKTTLWKKLCLRKVRVFNLKKCLFSLKSAPFHYKAPFPTTTYSFSLEKCSFSIRKYLFSLISAYFHYKALFPLKYALFYYKVPFFQMANPVEKSLETPMGIN